MARILGLDGGSIPPAGAANLAGVPEELRLGDVRGDGARAARARGPGRSALPGRLRGAQVLRVLVTVRYPYRTLTVVDPASARGGADAGWTVIRYG